MGMFDDLDEKAKELAAKARAALENPEEFLAKTRERVEAAVTEAGEEIREFAADPKAELQKLRDQVVDLLDCHPEKSDPAPPAEPAATTTAESPTQDSGTGGSPTP
ncbi:MAG: hypothetical protein ABJC19_08930 [Gemmatimonadota bacterium]